MTLDIYKTNTEQRSSAIGLPKNERIDRWKKIAETLKGLGCAALVAVAIPTSESVADRTRADEHHRPDLRHEQAAVASATSEQADAIGTGAAASNLEVGSNTLIEGVADRVDISQVFEFISQDEITYKVIRKAENDSNLPKKFPTPEDKIEYEGDCWGLIDRDIGTRIDSGNMITGHDAYTEPGKEGLMALIVTRQSVYGVAKSYRDGVAERVRIITWPTSSISEQNQTADGLPSSSDSSRQIDLTRPASELAEFVVAEEYMDICFQKEWKKALQWPSYRDPRVVVRSSVNDQHMPIEELVLTVSHDGGVWLRSDSDSAAAVVVNGANVWLSAKSSLPRRASDTTELTQLAAVADKLRLNHSLWKKPNMGEVSEADSRRVEAYRSNIDTPTQLGEFAIHVSAIRAA